MTEIAGLQPRIDDLDSADSDVAPPEPSFDEIRREAQEYLASKGLPDFVIKMAKIADNGGLKGLPKASIEDSPAHRHLPGKIG